MVLPTLFFPMNSTWRSLEWICQRFLCSMTLLYSSTSYSLFLPFFVLEIFKFKHDKVFVRHSASISEFKWFEQPWQRQICCQRVLVLQWNKHSRSSSLNFLSEPTFVHWSSHRIIQIGEHLVYNLWIDTAPKWNEDILVSLLN